jgi:hypothetical protein
MKWETPAFAGVSFSRPVSRILKSHVKNDVQFRSASALAPAKCVAGHPLIAPS